MSEETKETRTLPKPWPTRKDGNGYVGERERHKSRETGVLVILLDGSEPPMWLHRSEGRWVTLCEDHGYYRHWPSLGMARAWYAYPSTFCQVCAGTAEADHQQE